MATNRRRVTWWAVLLLSLVLFAARPGVAAAQADEEVFEVIGHLGGQLSSIVTEGGYLYYNTGPKVVIYSLSNPIAPQFVGRTPLVGHTIQRIDVEGNRLVAGYESGLAVIDIADRAAPRLVGRYTKETPALTTAVRIAGDRVYLSDRWRSLILSIAAPASPALLGYFNLPASYGMLDIEVRGDLVYAVAGGLRIYNAANPAAVDELSVLVDSFGAMVLQGNYAYFNGPGLRVVDVSDPAAPRLLGQPPAGVAPPPAAPASYANPIDIAIGGNVVYLTGQPGVVSAFDVTNPAAPVSLGHTAGVPSHESPRAFLDQHNGAAYYSDGYGLRVYNFTDPRHPTQAGHISTPARVASMAVIDRQYAWLAAADYDGIRVADIRNPANPTQIAHHLSTWYNALAVDGNTLHAVGDEWAHYRVFDVSDPLQLAFSDNPETGANGWSSDIVLEGNYAYLAANASYAFVVLDKSDPRDVHRLWSVYVNEPDWIEIEGDYAYVSNTRELAVIYLADRQSGGRVATLPAILPDGYMDIAFAGPYAYIATGRDSGESVLIYDMSNPAQPQRLGTFSPPGGAFAVEVEGNQALFYNDDGVVVADISSPAAPRSLGQFAMPHIGEAQRVGEQFYMAAGDGGFFILKFHPPAGPPPTYTISGRITDACARPIPDVEVTLDGTQTTMTDASGAYRFEEVERGQHTLEPFKVGFTFSPTQRVFTLGSHWSSANFQGGVRWLEVENRVELLVGETDERLDQTLGQAEAIAADGDYFRAQYQDDVAVLIANAVFNTVDILSGGVASVQRLKDGVKSHLPGMVGMGWGHFIRLRNNSAEAARLYRDVIMGQPIPAATPWLAKELLGGAETFFVASFFDESLEEMAQTGVTAGLTTVLRTGRPLQDGFYPALQRLTDAYRGELDATADATRQTLPLIALQPEEAAAYEEDLEKRSLANTHILGSVQRTALILESARSARAAADTGWFAPFLARFIGRALASLGGPVGVLAFDGLDFALTLYADIQTINEDARFLAVAGEGMAGALSAENRIFYNTVHGLDGLATCVPPQIALGEVASMEHRSFGHYVAFQSDLTWFERMSVTVVNVHNTSAYDTTYEALATYDVTGWLGWSHKPFLIQGARAVTASQTGPLLLRYKTEHDGESPREGEHVVITLLGATDTGVYHILNDDFIWDPERLPDDGRQAEPGQEDAPTRPYPLRNQVAVLADDLLYRPVIWIENPFDTTVNVTISQALPGVAGVVDPGDGEIAGGAIRWQRTLTPGQSAQLGYTVRLAGAAGQTLDYPAPQATLRAGADEAAFTGEVVAVELVSKLAASGRPPARVGPGQPLDVPFTLTNRAAGPATGTLYLRLYDAETGAQLRQSSRAVTVAAAGTANLALSLDTADVGEGDYWIVAELHSESAVVPVFGDVVTIAPYTIRLPLIRR